MRRRKIGGSKLVFVLFFSLLSACVIQMTVDAATTNTSYWNPTTEQMGNVSDAVVVDSENNNLGERDKVTWYAVTNDVEFNERVKINGTVNLILCSGATLNATKGITVESPQNDALTNDAYINDALIIWNEKADGTGTLIAGGRQTTDGHAAGIGSGWGWRSGVVTIYGGTVMAYGGEYGAGIGSGDMYGAWGGSGLLTVYGGTVTAYGGDKSAGIGGGRKGTAGRVILYGGTVEATGGDESMAIGTGNGTAYGPSWDSLLFEGDLKVTAGSDKNSAQLVTPYDKRADKCRQLYTKIEPCRSHTNTQVITETTHQKICIYCSHAENAENHIYQDCKCSVCGHEHIHSWAVDASGNKATVQCDTEGCPDGTCTVTLTANSGIYNNKEYTATVEKSGSLPNTINVGTPSYYKEQTALNAAPKDAGSYTAKAEVGNEIIQQDFTIKPKSLTKDMVTISPISTRADKKKITPTITVRDGSVLLEKEKDYSLSGETDATEVGKHTIKVSGKGNYTGVIDLAYTLTKPDSLSNSVKITLSKKLKVKQTKDGITITWKAVKDADGYQVRISYCNEKFSKTPTVTVNSGKTTSVLIKKIKGKKINRARIFKVYITAFQKKGRSKKLMGNSMTFHVVGSKNQVYSNVRSIKLAKKAYTLKVGKTAKIRAATILVYPKRKELSNRHALRFRYVSSDKTVATVNKKGKIKARSKGICMIYVYSRTGCAGEISVTVK